MMERPQRMNLSLNFAPPPPPRTPNEIFEEVIEKSGTLTLKGVQHKISSVSECKLLQELNSGSFGTVSSYQYKGVVMAVKSMIVSDPKLAHRAKMDLHIISQTEGCPHIVRYYGFLIHETEILIFMELMPMCLDRLLKRIAPTPVPEPYIGEIAVAVINALHFLKSKINVIHRDVKPSNILLNWEGQVKLCDFGISGMLKNSIANSTIGCVPYLAPERISVDSTVPDYDIRSDVWSLGITLLELANAEHPFVNCKHQFEMMSLIVDGPVPELKNKESFSPDFRFLLEKCLQKDCNMRSRYQELLTLPFIVNAANGPKGLGEWFSDVMEED